MELITLIVWLALCAIQDARHRQLPNWLTLGACALAGAYLAIYRQTWLGADASEGGLALLLSLVLTVPGYWLGKLGGADVKLLAALALATDRLILLGTFIGAGLTILLWAVIGQKIYATAVQGLKITTTQMDTEKSKKHPFAPFLFASFMMAVATFPLVENSG